MVDVKIIIIIILTLLFIIIPNLRKDNVKWTAKDLTSKYKSLKQTSKKDNLVIDSDRYLSPEVYDDLTTLINKEKGIKFNIFISYSINKQISLDEFLFELTKGIINKYEEKNSITLFFSVEDRIKVVLTGGKTIKLYLSEWDCEEGLKKFISSFEKKYFNYAVLGLTRYLLDTIKEGRKSIENFSYALGIIFCCIIIFPIIFFFCKNIKEIKEKINLYFYSQTENNEISTDNRCINMIVKVECVICLDIIPEESRRIVTSIKKKNSSIFECGHYFHTNCITAWKMKNNKCPICRRNLIIKL